MVIKRYFVYATVSEFYDAGYLFSHIRRAAVTKEGRKPVCLLFSLANTLEAVECTAI
jgi:hypothetical protein